jgi:DNA repair exonuclease SbcCD ATPase subunit
MKISERCKKQIEDIERLANEFKVLGEKEPHSVVMWDRDFEAITELYTAYKSTINQLEDITKLYNKANDYIDDFEKSEDRCATLEAENNRFRNTIKNMNENFREHLNALEAENHKLKDKVSELHTIKKSFEVLRALYLGDYEDDEPF